MTFLVITAALAWYAFGAFSHLYWWTKRHDYTLADVGLTIISGFLGPFNWWIGWMVCGEPRSTDRVLIARRTSEHTSPARGDAT